MDMFATYFAIDEDGSTGRERKDKLFEGLEISADKEFTDKYMGQFPVIFISLKSVYGETFEDAYGKLVEVVTNLGEKLSFLQDSEKISKELKKELALLKSKPQLSNQEYQSFLTEALKTFAKCLHKHYGKKVILLIDEYDVPLVKASEKGFHSEMVYLINQFFDIIKSDPQNRTTEKIVLTGCLKEINNSIYRKLFS